MQLNEIKNIKISDFDYPLPQERIALHPLPDRDSCRLLVASAASAPQSLVFSDLERLLESGTFLVRNNTKVINARLSFRKPTGSRIEVFLLEPLFPSDYNQMFQTSGNCEWKALVGNLKRWKEGPLSTEIPVPGCGRPVTLTAIRKESLSGNAHRILFSWDNPSVNFATLVDAAGVIPIPPYLNRDSEETDKEDYQTVYSRWQGSVAAPTAGLHFTDELFQRLLEKGVETGEVTLHVGAGTFQPVKCETIGDHPMHSETISFSRDFLLRLSAAIRGNRPVTAVGTTSVRTLESLPWLGALAPALPAGESHINLGQWEAYRPLPAPVPELLDNLLELMDRQGKDTLTATTSIMIAPGFHWNVTDRIITNFHQPQSTLLLLVSSFLERNGEKRATRLPEENAGPAWRKIYDYALENGYRFLSYGDSCFFT